MRYLGWVLGGLFLTDALLGLIGKRALVSRFNSAVGRKLPDPVGNTLKRATDVNDTTVKAMGINNLIAGAGMVLVATLTGLRRVARQRA